MGETAEEQDDGKRRVVERGEGDGRLPLIIYQAYYTFPYCP